MALTELLNESLQFIMFGGKGGVGKTTMAAATAVELAKEKKVLLFTTDPASSLTDSFGQAIGHQPTAIVGTTNLFAMEIDAKKALEEFKEKHSKDISDILQQGSYFSNPEIQAMFSLDLPGIDELMSLMKIADFMKSADYQVYIVDTAPTGPTLRLLMLSDLLDNWIKFLAGLRWKYHTVANAFAGGNQLEKADMFLLEMKKTVRRVKALLQNSEKTEFVAVTIAERMATSETVDLLRSLEQMRLPSRHIIINNVMPLEAPDSVEQWDRRGEETLRDPSARPFFNSSTIGFRQILGFAQMRRRTQEKYIRETKEKFGTRIITEVFLQPTEIQGIGSLQKLGAYLFAETKGEIDASSFSLLSS